MTIYQIKSKLQEVAILENTELGDYLEALVNVDSCGTTCASDEFKAAIEKEMEVMYAWVFENYEIREVTETRKALRWKEKV